MRRTCPATCLARFILPLLAVAACGGSPGAPGALRPAPDAGQPGDPGPSLQRTDGWSVRRRMRLPVGTDVVLEERLASFTVAEFVASRLRRVDAPNLVPWSAPAGLLIEDAALHPAGAVTAVLVDADFAVWLARLSPALALLALGRLDDPDIARDPCPLPGGPQPGELRANSLPRDSVRTAPDGEEAVVVVMTPLESVVLYRLTFSSRWESPRRTLVLPVSHHIP